MRLQVMSDLHLDFEPMTAPDVDADVVILAGDLHEGGFEGIHWAATTWPDKTVLLVAGNHDFYRTSYSLGRARMRKIADTYHNVFLLDRDYLVVKDVLFVGSTLWTDFLLEASSADDIVTRDAAMVRAARYMADYHLIAHCGRRLLPKDTMQFFNSEHRYIREMLMNSGFEFAARHGIENIRKRVVITHHAPSARSVHSQYKYSLDNAAFASSMDGTVALADLWIHGHTHTSFDYEIEREDGHKARVVCNPRGYADELRCENPDFNPELVIEV